MTLLALLLILILLAGTTWTELVYSKELQCNAEAGDNDAQFMLALCLQAGSGIEADELTARHWFSKAAGQGHAEAAFILGILYPSG